MDTDCSKQGFIRKKGKVMDETVIVRDSVTGYTIGVFDSWDKGDAAKEKWEKDHNRKVEMIFLTKNKYYDPISKFEIEDFGGTKEQVNDH